MGKSHLPGDLFNLDFKGVSIKSFKGKRCILDRRGRKEIIVFGAVRFILSRKRLQDSLFLQQLNSIVLS